MMTVNLFSIHEEYGKLKGNVGNLAFIISFSMPIFLCTRKVLFLQTSKICK